MLPKMPVFSATSNYAHRAEYRIDAYRSRERYHRILYKWAHRGPDAADEGMSHRPRLIHANWTSLSINLVRLEILEVRKGAHDRFLRTPGRGPQNCSADPGFSRV